MILWWLRENSKGEQLADAYGFDRPVAQEKRPLQSVAE